MSEMINHSTLVHQQLHGYWGCNNCDFRDRNLGIVELHAKAGNCYKDLLSIPVDTSPMTQTEYFQEFERLMAEELETTRMKNSDYAHASDAFANFRLIENITQGRISLEDGILCRITDKIKRVASLLQKPAEVKEESLDDNLKDIAVYCRIWRIYRQDQLRRKS